MPFQVEIENSGQDGPMMYTTISNRFWQEMMFAAVLRILVKSWVGSGFI